MRRVTASDLVIELLRTLDEARSDWDARSDGEGVLLMPSAYTYGSYRELERRLDEMRDAGGELRELWWHTCLRYRWGTRRRAWVAAARTKRGVVPLSPTGSEVLVMGEVAGDGPTLRAQVILRAWDQRADDALAGRGVAHLLTTMYAGDTARIRLPIPYLHRLLGIA